MANGDSHGYDSEFSTSPVNRHDRMMTIRRFPFVKYGRCLQRLFHSERSDSIYRNGTFWCSQLSLKGSVMVANAWYVDCLYIWISI